LTAAEGGLKTAWRVPAFGGDFLFGGTRFENPLQQAALKMGKARRLIPNNHPSRKINVAVDFSCIHGPVCEVQSPASTLRL
jgi:hypothetical protein